MNAAVRHVPLTSIRQLRALYLQEMNTQVRYHACHDRGMSDSYIFTVDGQEVGYGSVKGKDDPTSRDTVFEFFLIKPFRQYADTLLRELIMTAGAAWIECQSNDPLLSPLLFRHAKDINADTVLFEDHTATDRAAAGAVFRRRHGDDQIFQHTSEPAGEYVAILDGRVVATGGFLLHYNEPFADLYMEVDEPYRRRGLGSFLVQEVKKACYLAGRVPSARCDVHNAASRAALLSAGMRISGYMLAGRTNI